MKAFVKKRIIDYVEDVVFLSRYFSILLALTFIMLCTVSCANEKPFDTSVGTSSSVSESSLTDTVTVSPQDTSYQTEQTSDLPPETQLPIVDDNGVDPDKPMIALTFDDGPNGSTTERIVEILEAYDARATFFVVGSRVSGEVQKKAMTKAIDAGCEIGCHTYSHPRMWDLTEETLQNEINDCKNAVSELVGAEIKYFRPSGGNLPDFVYDCGYPIILWSVDTEDWKSRDSEQICKNIKENVFDGCIILMHDLYSSTADACEEIIPWLDEQGYQMVTVSELFEARDVVPAAGDVFGRVRKQT